MKGGRLMMTIKRKTTLCNTNIHLLNIIWRLGKGIMFKIHIEKYMEVFYGVKPIDTWKQLKELNTNMIVEWIKLRNIVVIKLRKYALQFLLQKDRAEISAISVTYSKIKKTAFINTIIQNHISSNHIKATFERVANYYENASTFLSSEKKGYKVIERLFNKGIFNNYALSEINELKEIDSTNKSCLKSSKSKIPSNNVSKYTHRFNLNSMQSQGIYIDSAKLQANGGHVTLYIAILDLNNSLDVKKVSNKINSTFSYLSLFTPNNIKIHFNVYTASSERYKLLLRLKHSIDKHFIDTKVSGSFTWEVTNLEIEKKLFGNQKILLQNIK